jgi:hypothetical protein
VRVINNSPNDIAVQLRIDGINMFAFSELKEPEMIDGKPNPRKGQPRCSILVISARSSFAIPGWHLSNNRWDRFQTAMSLKPTAASFSKTADLRLVTVVFQELSKKRRNHDGWDEDTMCRGMRIDQKFEEVEVYPGQIIDVISVRYKIPQMSK